MMHGRVSCVFETRWPAAGRAVKLEQRLTGHLDSLIVRLSVVGACGCHWQALCAFLLQQCPSFSPLGCSRDPAVAGCCLHATPVCALLPLLSRQRLQMPGKRSHDM